MISILAAPELGRAMEWRERERKAFEEERKGENGLLEYGIRYR